MISDQMDLYLNGRAKPPPSPGGLADATLRTMALLSDSRRLAKQLQDWSNELRRNQAELRRSQVELGEKAKVLAATSQRKSDILAGMSHELRTPLAIMRTEVDVALADPDATLDDLRSMAEALRETIDRSECHRGILEDLSPLAEGLVCSDQEGAALIASADQLEQHGGFRLILGGVHQIV